MDHSLKEEVMKAVEESSSTTAPFSSGVTWLQFWRGDRVCRAWRSKVSAHCSGVEGDHEA
jgi:hypothetical protein